MNRSANSTTSKMCLLIDNMINLFQHKTESLKMFADVNEILGEFLTLFSEACMRKCFSENQAFKIIEYFIKKCKNANLIENEELFNFPLIIEQMVAQKNSMSS